MPLFRRRPVPPVVRDVSLPPGDRRVAWATTAEGAAVVATEGGLLLPARDALLPWRQVERATWERPLLRVREADRTASAGVLHELALEDPGDLPAVVRDRVTGSVAWSQYAKVAPEGGVRVVGRRVPGADLLEWQLVFDAGTDVADPLVRAQAEHALKAARRTIG